MKGRRYQFRNSIEGNQDISYIFDADIGIALADNK